MEEEKHEGVVLRSIDYKDRQKIITLFTPTRGLISLIVKGITKKRTHLLTLTSPFTQAEYHFTIRRSDLYSFRDGTPLNTHHAMRISLAHIHAATTIAKALLKSQLPDKPAPALYQLTTTYFSQLPQFPDPTSLSASFLLKLLKHDGHLAITPHCSTCSTPASHLHQGESFCTTHVPPYAHPFTPSEWSTITTLTDTRAIAQLQKISISPELHQKIEMLFEKNF